MEDFNDIKILDNTQSMQWLSGQVGGRWTWQLSYDYMLGRTDGGAVLLPRLNADLDIAGQAVAQYNDTGREVWRREKGDMAVPFGCHLLEDAAEVLIFDNELTALLASAKFTATAIAITNRPSEEMLRRLAYKRTLAMPSTTETLGKWRSWLGGSVRIATQFTHGGIENDVTYWLQSLRTLPVFQRRRLETDTEITNRIDVELRQPTPRMDAIQALQRQTGSRTDKLQTVAEKAAQIEKEAVACSLPPLTPMQQAVSGYRFTRTRKEARHGA